MAADLLTLESFSYVPTSGSLRMLFPMPGMPFPLVPTLLTLTSFSPLLRHHLCDTFLGYPLSTVATPHLLCTIFPTALITT